ncbi:hypothetical protein FRC05_002385 [Tulasnella sp. 425]|nr:hypothetical protein FRC05_002385 [Tulasnella sp. 425]
MSSETTQAQISASGGNPPLIDHSRPSQDTPKCHQILDRVPESSGLEKPWSGSKLAGKARTAVIALTKTAAAMTAAIRLNKEPSVVEDPNAFLDEYKADLEGGSQDALYRDQFTEISNMVHAMAKVANVLTQQKAKLDNLKLELDDYNPAKVLVPNDNLVAGTGEAEVLILRNMTCKWLNGAEATVKQMHSKDGPRFTGTKFAIWKMVMNNHYFVAAKGFYGPLEQEDSKYGTVRDYITYHPEADRLQLIHDVALGLQYVHNRNILHGKLRTDNILVDLNQRARISGFSLSKFPNGRAQTKDWYAFMDDPRWNPIMQTRWTAKSDIWCWAMTALEILSGDRPFPDIPCISGDDMARMQNGTLRPAREDYRSSIPSEPLWRLLESCWSVEEVDRPDIGTVVQGVADERIKTGWDPLKWNPKPEPKKDWDWPESS